MDSGELNADGGGGGYLGMDKVPPPSISITFPDNSPVSGGSCNTPSCFLNVPLGLSKTYQ